MDQFSKSYSEMVKGQSLQHLLRRSDVEMLLRYLGQIELHLAADDAEMAEVPLRKAKEIAQRLAKEIR